VRALQWLMRVQTIDGRFVPIGNEGWYARGGRRARFSQQPIEADTSVAACAAAYRATHDPAWIAEATRAFRWFVGYNDLGVPVWDESTGGCRDGLGHSGVSDNQGAESTLAWLNALAEMHELSEARELERQQGAAEPYSARVRSAWRSTEGNQEAMRYGARGGGAARPGLDPYGGGIAASPE